MNSKIEKGCLAMVINSVAGNDGICLTVGDFVVSPDHWIHKDYWESSVELTGVGGKKCPLVREYNLLRIDGHIEETQEESISETA